MTTTERPTFQMPTPDENEQMEVIISAVSITAAANSLDPNIVLSAVAEIAGRLIASVVKPEYHDKIIAGVEFAIRRRVAACTGKEMPDPIGPTAGNG
jgi:hypothetical protein